MLSAFFLAVKYMLDLNKYYLPLKYSFFSFICVSIKYYFSHFVLTALSTKNVNFVNAVKGFFKIFGTF